MSNKKIVVIGGGTGTFAVLSALKNYPVQLSAIVSMADSGGSTGRLRDQYGVLPPGDIRRSLVALSNSGSALRGLFNYRFSGGDLRGHNFGNIFLSALEKITGSFDKAVKEAGRVLNIKGKVIPVTLKNVNLCARLENGQIVRGENNIDLARHGADMPIKKIWLRPEAAANPEAKRAILEANVIIIGPGDLYTSIIPNFLVRGIKEATKKSKAKKIYVCNLMTKNGETNNYSVKSFADAIKKYLGGGSLDYILANKSRPDRIRIKKYAQENSEVVKIPARFKPTGLIKADLVSKRGLIRHDPAKLAKALTGIISQNTAA